jgi:hypothetical protein
MDGVLTFFATNRFMVSIANIVAVVTALYFLWKICKWAGNFVNVIYRTNIKTAISRQIDRLRDEGKMCADDSAYYMAFITMRVMKVIGSLVIFFALFISTQDIYKQEFIWDRVVDGATLYLQVALSLYVFVTLARIDLTSQYVLRERSRRRLEDGN